MTLFYVTLVCTTLMMGLVWFIQIGFLPLLQYVRNEDAETFHEERRTNFMMVMFPVLGMETMSSLFLLIKAVNSPLFATFSLSFILHLAMILLHFFGIFPSYALLKNGFDMSVYKKLKIFGWIRVAIWTIRFFILISVIQLG